MKIERFFPHLVSLSLLVLGGVYNSPAFAVASVVGVLGILAHALVAERLSALQVKPGVPEEVKRQIQDLNARVATIEYGVKTRGF